MIHPWRVDVIPLQELKAIIREEIANITSILLVSVMKTTRKRFVQCMDSVGRHLFDLIFKNK